MGTRAPVTWMAPGSSPLALGQSTVPRAHTPGPKQSLVHGPQERRGWAWAGRTRAPCLGEKRLLQLSPSLSNYLLGLPPRAFQLLRLFLPSHPSARCSCTCDSVGGITVFSQPRGSGDLSRLACTGCPSLGSTGFLHPSPPSASTCPGLSSLSTPRSACFLLPLPPRLGTLCLLCQSRVEAQV